MGNLIYVVDLHYEVDRGKNPFHSLRFSSLLLSITNDRIAFLNAERNKLLSSLLVIFVFAFAIININRISTVYIPDSDSVSRGPQWSATVTDSGPIGSFLPSRNMEF